MTTFLAQFILVPVGADFRFWVKQNTGHTIEAGNEL